MYLLLAWIPPIDTETPLKIRGWNVAGYSTICSTSSNTNTIWRYKITCNGLNLFSFNVDGIFFLWYWVFATKSSVHRFSSSLRQSMLSIVYFQTFYFIAFQLWYHCCPLLYFCTVSYDWRSCNPNKLESILTSTSEIWVELFYIRFVQSQVPSMKIVILKLDCLKSYTENIIVWTFVRILLPAQPNIPAPQCGRNYYRQRSYPWLSSLHGIHLAGFQLRWQVIRAEILEIFHKTCGSTVLPKFHIIPPSTYASLNLLVD